MKTRNVIVAMALVGSMSACATPRPSAQLASARAAHVSSSQGLAAKFTPTEVYEAKKVLDRANAEFAENGDSVESRDLAYIAHRKLELADTKARTEVDRLTIAGASKAGVLVRDSQVKHGEAALASTREQLLDERRDASVVAVELRAANSAQGKELELTAAQLEAEKQGRLTAEGRLAGAMKDLATIAAVKEEARGMVITLSGSILFASGKYALLNTAMTKLDQVAEALKAQDAGRRMIVEGHTDSRGSDAINQPLSVNRATAVRDYLVSRGVASEKITAVGMGSSKSIADNKTAENRANNRRVEIVISNAQVSAR